MFILIGFLALALDISVAMMDRRDAQNAPDHAGGESALQSSRSLSSTYSPLGTATRAIRRV